MATIFTATPQPSNNPPRTLLELTYTGQTQATVTRLDPDGAARAVRLAEPATLSGGAWVGYDYESWFGRPTTYTAITSAGSISTGAVTLAVDRPWLRHPGIPSLSMEIDYQGDGTPVRPANLSVLEPLGRSSPIVLSDGQRKSKRGTITIRTRTLGEAATLLALTDDLSVLLLDIPPGLNYGITHEYRALGDLNEDRLQPDWYKHPWRIWTAPFTTVDRPAGGLQAQRTWATVIAEAPTWSALLNTYSTWSDVLTGDS
ncbi:hypothetical protein GCM10010435_44490 [Winogradskya consettensis]|uniref:Uncharacterized protein n=1 Tax=Winogradskya consettensis TaxID=113560 RepID=A0A919VZV7_9ACTN|nr:hypothetical protein [Actinoplanes consettensis]GIM82710.1 hypothetical protein Aco04nite_82880 [Actinoplanes consettensis]